MRGLVTQLGKGKEDRKWCQVSHLRDTGKEGGEEAPGM